MSDVSKISCGGVVHKIKDENARNCNTTLFQQQNFLYKGKDLTEAFNKEIAKFSDEWAWIKNRITNANYEGIYIGDYIPLNVNGEVMQMQIAGIDCYYNSMTTPVSHHIDFISRNCFSQNVSWNSSPSNNNGNADNPCPFIVSNLYQFLNKTLYNYLPNKVKTQIKDKILHLEGRFSEDGKLLDSESFEEENMGKLWVPTEFEVFGTVVWGTKGYSGVDAVQYPIFANSYLNRVKKRGNTETRAGWWLASVLSDDSTGACGVSNSGTACYWATSNKVNVPICFRITA